MQQAVGGMDKYRSEANGSTAQGTGGRDLLLYPVTVEGVLGLWSLISGGTEGGTREAETDNER